MVSDIQIGFESFLKTLPGCLKTTLHLNGDLLIDFLRILEVFDIEKGQQFDNIGSNLSLQIHLQEDKSTL